MSPRTVRIFARLFVLAVTLTAVITPSAAAQDRWIDNTIRGMTLEEKVGQLFVANVYGRTANTKDLADVSANQAMYGPGIRNANH